LYVAYYLTKYPMMGAETMSSLAWSSKTWGEHGMESTVEVRIEFQTKLMGCAHYPNCLMQALNDSSGAEDFSCVPCPLYQHEVTKDKELG
jgi:hypothetical protein